MNKVWLVKEGISNLDNLIDPDIGEETGLAYVIFDFIFKGSKIYLRYETSKLCQRK